MTAFTIVTTTATQGSDAAEVSTLSDDFTNESEALGYSRRMAEELVEMAHQLALDFDFRRLCHDSIEHILCVADDLASLDELEGREAGLGADDELLFLLDPFPCIRVGVGCVT